MTAVPAQPGALEPESLRRAVPPLLGHGSGQGRRGRALALEPASGPPRAARMLLLSQKLQLATASSSESCLHLGPGAQKQFSAGQWAVIGAQPSLWPWGCRGSESSDTSEDVAQTGLECFFLLSPLSLFWSIFGASFELLVP